MFINREGPMFSFVAKIHHFVTKKMGLAKKAQRFFSRKKSHKVLRYFEQKKVSQIAIFMIH
jgi:hypothetical protein